MSLALNKPKLDNLADEIWKSAERLRGKFKPYEYQNVVLPIIVIRRLECVLIKWREEKSAEVLAKRPELTEKELAKLVKGIDEKGLRVRADDLRDFHGVGDAKATLVLAALAFARHRIKPEGSKIETPADLLPHVRHYAERNQEHFLCASINGANEILTPPHRSLTRPENTP